MNIVRFAFLMALGLAISGCAAPRYQTFYSYLPPTDGSGLACLQNCAQTKENCLDDCGRQYTICVRGLEPEVQTLHRDALARYEGELKHYQRDLSRYHLSLSLGWTRNSTWYGSGFYDPWWPHPGYYPYASPPQKPEAPDYAETLHKLSAEKCAKDCGCQPNYDACFLGCGGSMQAEQRCIANCPE